MSAFRVCASASTSGGPRSKRSPSVPTRAGPWPGRGSRTPAGDYRATVAAIRALVHGIEAELGAGMTVGVGIPGALVPSTGLVKNANSTWLIGRPLGRDLEAALARPVRLANDANCFALSEASDGAAAGFGAVFGVILGTGVGGGSWSIGGEGRRRLPARLSLGEWGHNPLPWPRAEAERPGPPRYCGRTTAASSNSCRGPGLPPTTRRAWQAATSPPPHIAAAAAAGDEACHATLDRYADRLARALAGVINIPLDPDADRAWRRPVGRIASLYDAVPRRWGEFVFSDTVVTKLLPPAHGDSSGVRGAAWLWRPDDVSGASS